MGQEANNNLKNIQVLKICKESGLVIYFPEEDKMSKLNSKKNFIKNVKVYLKEILYLLRKIFVKNKIQVLLLQKL
jgi:hypothetical protein